MLRYVLRAGVGILLLQVLCGCNPHVQRYSPYKDIFPDGYVIENESNSADLKEFKKSTLAIIPSANLERHVVAWKNLYEKGGVDAAKAQSRVFVGLLRTIKPIETAGLSDSGMDQGWKNNQQLTSPENILDKFVYVVRPYFNKITTANDIDSARASRADYIVVFDYHGTYNSYGSEYTSSVYLDFLSSRLRRIFSISDDVSVDRVEVPVFSSVQANIETDGRTIANALRLNFINVAKQLNTAFSKRQ